MACGANVPFADQEIFFGPIAEYADNKISIIPDFIANCGMARVFAYLMSNDLPPVMTDASIFEDTSDIIKNAIQASYNTNNSKTNIAKTAFEIALKKLI
ncbi:MAG: glutamate dehydrogenase/leucine dehydrogenase [Flavobacteriales bacterium]